MLTGVSTVRDTEAKVKVEALQQVIAEIVPLDHPKIVQGSVSNCEFHPVGKQREGWKGCLTVRDKVANCAVGASVC